MGVNRIKFFKENSYNNIIILGTCLGVSYWIIRFSFFSAIEYFRTTFNRSAVLKITEEGIDDNLSIFSLGFIPWDEVSDVKMTTFLNVGLLTIVVKDPNKFTTHLGKFKKGVITGFIKKYGGPILISQNRVNISITELRNILMEKLNN